MSGKNIIFVMAFVFTSVVLGMDDVPSQIQHQKQPLFKHYGLKKELYQTLPAEIRSIICNNIVDYKQWWYAEKVFSHKNHVCSVSFDPSGDYLLTGCSDGKARIFNRATLQKTTSFHLGGGYATEVCFDPTGKYIVGGSYCGKTRIFNRVNPDDYFNLSDNCGDYSYSVCFDPTGRYAATGNGFTMYLFDRNAAWKKCVSFSTGQIARVRFDPTGKYILIASANGKICILSKDTGQLRSCFSVCFPDACYTSAGHYWVSDACYDSTGHSLLMGSSRGNSACIFDVNTQKKIISFPHDSSVFSVCFDPIGKYVLTGSVGNACIFDRSTGKQYAFLFHGDYVVSVGYDSTGKYIVTGSHDHKARIFVQYDKWTLEQLLLIRIMQTWLRIEKPNKSIQLLDSLLDDIELKFGCDKKELKNIMQTFPEKVRFDLWNTMKIKINRYGKTSALRIVLKGVPGAVITELG